MTTTDPDNPMQYAESPRAPLVNPADEIDTLLLNLVHEVLAPIVQIMQKPENYEQLDTLQQQVWVIMAMGQVGTYLDETVAALTEKPQEGETI